MRIRHYVVLTTFVVLGLIGSAYERSRPDDEASRRRAWAMSTLVERYPERPLHLYYRGVWALETGDLATARRLFARAIGQRFYANEGLLHHHARLLVEAGASKREIDDAVRLWEKHYPNSRNPNPRLYARGRRSGRGSIAGRSRVPATGEVPSSDEYAGPGRPVSSRGSGR